MLVRGIKSGFGRLADTLLVYRDITCRVSPLNNLSRSQEMCFAKASPSRGMRAALYSSPSLFCDFKHRVCQPRCNYMETETQEEGAGGVGGAAAETALSFSCCEPRPAPPEAACRLRSSQQALWLLVNPLDLPESRAAPSPARPPRGSARSARSTHLAQLLQQSSHWTPSAEALPVSQFQCGMNILLT